jgi:outer membrane assembly lipoprotein YfiO
MIKGGLAILGLVYLSSLWGCAHDRHRRTSAETYIEEAQQALQRKKCWDAQELYRNLLTDFPGSHLVDEAQYGLGQAYLCSKDYVTAIFEYERLLNEFPTSPHVDEARYQIGMCYYKQSRGIHHDQDETKKAIREFRRFIEDFPASDLVPETEERIKELRSKLAEKDLMIAENYLKWKYYQSVERYCEMIQDSYKEVGIVNRSRFLLARAKHLQGKLNEALEMLGELSGEASEELKTQVTEEIQKVRESIAKSAPESVSVQDPIGGSQEHK